MYRDIWRTKTIPNYQPIYTHRRRYLVDSTDKETLLIAVYTINALLLPIILLLWLWSQNTNAHKSNNKSNTPKKKKKNNPTILKLMNAFSSFMIISIFPRYENGIYKSQRKTIPRENQSQSGTLHVVSASQTQIMCVIDPENADNSIDGKAKNKQTNILVDCIWFRAQSIAVYPSPSLNVFAFAKNCNIKSN